MAVSKPPPKPKFGEVGFTFPVMAKVVKSIPDNEDSYPISIEFDLGSYEDSNWVKNGVLVSYERHADFKEFYAKCDPKFLKTQKQEELKQAQALVVKLTKELTLIK
jgi:hypothetical protein